MFVKMFYRQNSEHERQATDYVRDFEHQTGKRVELIDIDSPDGIVQGDLYDIVRVPTLIATQNDGQLMHMWSEEHLPLFSEVTYYTQGQLANAALGAL